MAVARILSGNDQVIGDYGRGIVQFDDVEIVSADVLGKPCVGRFDPFTFIVKIAIRSDAQKILCDGAIDSGWILVLGRIQELFLPLDELLFEAGERLRGSRRGKGGG